MSIEKGLNIFEKPEEKREKAVLKEKLKFYYESFPERREAGNNESNIAKEMTLFLVDNGYINEVKEWNSWGCKYEEGVIFINQQEMPRKEENYYIFRLGKNSLTGEHLFPKIGDGVGGEVDAYRFLHETNHAYQEYLRDKEGTDRWFERAISAEKQEEISPLKKIFKFCYDKRRESRDKGLLCGLSTFGNVPDYEEWGIQKARDYLEGRERSEENIERAIDYGWRCEDTTRSLEDANELTTMYLWHPEYLDTFLNYLSGNISRHGSESLKKDRLVMITNEEKETLKKIVLQYIEEMKDEIEYKNNEG